MKKQLIVGVAVLLVVTAGVSWFLLRPEKHNDQVKLHGNVDIRQVSLAFDGSERIAALYAEEGDLVITADIPLAAEVIEKGAHALNPRGELYTTENIRKRLNMRDFMDTMRSSGLDTGGPPPLSQGDRKAFANALDRHLARL